MDYDKILETLTGTEEDRFAGSADERLEASQQLLGNESIDSLVVVGAYRFIRNHFKVDEPERQIEINLNDAWLDILKMYGGLSPSSFLDEAAKHYHGSAPERDEVLPKDTYDKIYSAFHTFHLPAMVMGRADSKMFAGQEPEHTLQRILTGYERLKSRI